MASEFELFGPFFLEPSKNNKGSKFIQTGDIHNFWKVVAESGENILPEKQGCYVFSIKAGSGFKPWYIGKTSKQSFRQEVFNGNNINKFNAVLFNNTHGRLAFYFIAKAGNKKTVSNPDAARIEKLLISYAVKKNENLLNIHYTKDSGIRIKGVINSKGKQSQDQIRFKTMMGI